MNELHPSDLDTVAQVLGALPDAVCVVDREGRIHATNDRFVEKVAEGGSIELLADLVDQTDALRSAMQLWFSSGTSRPTALTVGGHRYRCDGARLSTTAYAIVTFRSHTETVEAFRATSKAVDLDRLERTKRRLRDALRGLEHANEALRASNEELDRFASIISHDLQSPLAIIHGMAQLLAEDDLDDSERQEFVDSIVRNVKKMQQQVAGILEVARAGNTADVESPVPAGEVIEEVRELLSSELDANGSVLTVDDDLPALPLARAEAVQLMQNLIHNAVKFARDDEHSPRVRVSGSSQDGAVVVSVEDNGPGVPTDAREKVFDLFHRLDTSRGGTGIGLATCRRIVQRHGGTIWVEDSRLGGAAFRFSLPAKASASRDEQGL